MRRDAIRGFVGLFLGLICAVACAAGDESPVPLSVSPEQAASLRAQLSGLPPHDLLRQLGIADIAELHSVVPVPMRDGIRLSATVILPRAHAKQPVILIRSPYLPASELSEDFATDLFARLVRNGYGVVLVNDRGTQWSEGRYQWLKGANDDGYDTLDWISHQPWSNGKVGTFGCSSSAESQPPLATRNHPAHKAMVEMAGATAAGVIPSYDGQGIFYHGGVPDLAWSWWYRRFGLRSRPVIPADVSQDERERLAGFYSPEPEMGAIEFATLTGHLPSADLMRASGAPLTEWDRLIRLSPASAEWKEYDFVRSGDRTQVPGLHIDSWHDMIEAYPTVKMYQYLAGNSPNQHLVMGPTAHCEMGHETEATSVGDRTVGDGRFDYVSMVSGWFDRWLKDDRSVPELPAIRYYVLNSSEWKTAEAWPPRGAETRRLYLSSGGHANSAGGDGVLSVKAPSVAHSDVFVSDPSQPVPSLGGSCCSDQVSRDQSGIEARQDVLVYTTEPYAARTRIVGDVVAHLAVASDVPDADLMLKLVDVDPAGHAYNVADTALRLRYRDGMSSPKMMVSGKPYEVTVTGMVTAMDMAPGHRLRIEIAGSNFPNYERNLHTGGRNYDETAMKSARLEIMHGPRQASFLEFSVLPK